MLESQRLQRISRELVALAFTQGRALEPWVLERVTSLLDEKRVAAGEIIYHAGDMPELIYFMSEGRVRFEREGASSWTLEGRWVFGTNEAIADRPRTRTTVAGTDLFLTTIPAERWVELLEDSFTLARNVGLVGARTVAALHARLTPDGGFLPPTRPTGRPTATGPLNLVDRVLILGEASLFHNAGVQPLTNLAGVAEEVIVGAGDAVFHRGEPRDRMFVVADGLVEASREDPNVTGRFGPGQIVGGAAGVGDASLPWQARALMPSRVLSVQLDAWAAEMEEHFDLVRAAIGTLSDERERLLDRLAARSDGLVLR